MDTDHRTLGTLFDGLADLPGAPTHDIVGGPLLRHLASRGDVTWGRLASMTPAMICQIKGIGPTRLSRVLAEIGRCVEASAAADRRRAESGPGLRRDPVAAGELFLASLSDRDAAIAERVLDFDGSAPTLQQIGDRFGVTRERIRQIESRLCERIGLIQYDPDYAELWEAATRLRERLGARVPLESIVDDFAAFPPDPLDLLVLHLAGPYRLHDGWIVRTEIPAAAETVLTGCPEVASNQWEGQR